MPQEIKEALDKLGKDWEEFKKSNDERIVKLEKGEAVGELEAKISKIEESISKTEEIKTKIEEMEKALARRNEGGEKGFDGQELTEDQIAHKKAFADYVRKGSDQTRQQTIELAKKTMRVGSDPDGGYFVDADTSGRMVTKLFDSSPMRQLASVQSITTDRLEGMYDDEEAAVTWDDDEYDIDSGTTTPQFGKWIIPVHQMSYRRNISQQLIEDASVNVEALLQDKAVSRMAREEGTQFVLGDGVGKPKGFLDYAASDTYSRTTIQQVVSGSAAALTGDGLISLVYALRPEYLASATVVAARTAFAAIRKLKDGNDQYLWQPGLQAGEPSTVLGVSTLVFDDMPAVAANALSVAIADWKEAYQIVDRLGFSVLRDPYTATPFVRFYFRRRVGAAVTNTDAIKIQKIAA